jgi:hypothetical protein
MLEQVGVDLRAGVAGAHDEYALPASSSEDRSRLREYGRLSQVAAPPRTLGDIVAVWERPPSPHAWSARRGPDEPMPIAWQTTDHLA